MTLIIERIREMWWLFGMILPLEGASNKEAIKVALGHGLEEIIPDMMIVISQYAERDPEGFEMFCEFIVEALDYMRGNRNKHPALDNINFEEYVESMQIQLGRYTKAEKKKNVEKFEKLQEKAPERELEPDR